MTGRNLTVAVLGASGYTGGELCRLLLGHPDVATVLPAARTTDPYAEVHPNLAASGLRFHTLDEVRDRAREIDVVFFCTPSGEAMNGARHFLDQGARVVDVSADFRFGDLATYERTYGRTHAAPDLVAEAVYGLTELNREKIRGSRLVANPGCYAITALLAVAPLLQADLADPGRPIAVHALNGTSGAGSKPRREIMHAEMATSPLAYSLQGHRHGPELEHHFGLLAGTPVEVDINTTHGTFARGIHLQANVRTRTPVSRADLVERYLDFYGAGHEKEYFVQVVATPRRGKLNDKEYGLYPSLASVVGSNFCHLGLDHDPARGITKVVGVTDNLVKGAAGSAIQNMNVMVGLPETAGLTAYAL
jgi:N-acetyl-gamma-glutamyl-phosphate reductase common form